MFIHPEKVFKKGSRLNFCVVCNIAIGFGLLKFAKFTFSFMQHENKYDQDNGET